MKNTEKRFLLPGISVFAVALCSFIPVSLGQNAANDGTVSAVGTPVPTAPDAATAGQEFPPQPVSVAPAEEATPTAAVETPPAQTAQSPATSASSPVPSTTTPVVDAPTPPPQDGLNTSGLTPVPQGAQGDVKGTNVMGSSGVREKHSGTYYDADALVPDSDLAAVGATGPRKVDPAVEPGQKYVIVKKDAAEGSYEAQYVAATRALKLGRYAAAMEMFEKLYKKNHRDPRILMGLAVAQQGAGFNESAAQTYEDLLKIEPNNADAIVNLMGIMKGQYPSVTLKKLVELRKRYPNNAGIAAQIGLTNAELKNYDDALRYLEIAASIDPRSPSHIYNMAIITDRKGDTKNAIRLYERALQMDAALGETVNGLPREEIYDRLVVLRRRA